MSVIHLVLLFLAKMIENGLGTVKTILIQRSKCLLAGLTVTVSNCIYFSITRNIVTADSDLAILVVSIAGGIGCAAAMMLNQRYSRERTYVNVIMSDDLDAMRGFRDFLAQHHITNVATDSYTRDWNMKSIAVTAYAETKAQSLLITRYLDEREIKCKRMIQKN